MSQKGPEALRPQDCDLIASKPVTPARALKVQKDKEREKEAPKAPATPAVEKQKTKCCPFF